MLVFWYFADKKGADGIIVNEDSTCPLNSTVSKTSSGAMEIMEVNSVNNVFYFLIRLSIF